MMLRLETTSKEQRAIAYRLTGSKYPMNFSYTGGCSGGAPGQCASAEQCPGAFWGTDTENGTPVNCLGNNAGVSLLLLLIGGKRELTRDNYNILLILRW